MSVTLCGAESRLDRDAYAGLETRVDLTDLQANDLICRLPRHHHSLPHARCLAVVKDCGQGSVREVWALWVDGRAPRVETHPVCSARCALWRHHRGAHLPFTAFATVH